MRFLAMLAVLAALTPWAAGQRGSASGGRAGVAAHASVQHFGAGNSLVGRGGFGRSRFGRYGYGAPYDYLSLPFPFFGDAYDSGDIYSTGYPVAASLPPYLPPPGSAFRSYGDFPGPEPSSQTSQSSQPLMIELKNGRYVRVSSTAINGEALPLNGWDSRGSNNGDANVLAEMNSSRGPSGNGPMVGAPATGEMAPVILLFRDGHSEQVRDYTITNGILYARGDYYTDGYWNKKIDLSGLNVGETLQANAEHGVKFILPSSPNEVVTRP